MIQFTPSVGTAPSTTTIQMNGLGCGQCMLGECAPGYFGPAVMLPGSAPPPQPLAGVQAVFLNPYANEARLTGLQGLQGTGMRWDLFALALGVGFAGVLGTMAWRKHKRR